MKFLFDARPRETRAHPRLLWVNARSLRNRSGRVSHRPLSRALPSPKPGVGCLLRLRLLPLWRFSPLNANDLRMCWCMESRIPLAVDFSVHPFQFSVDLAEVRPGRLARRTKNSKVPARLTFLSPFGLVVLPFCGRNHGHMGRQSEAPHAAACAKIRPEAWLRRRGRRLQDPTSTFPPSYLVATA